MAGEPPELLDCPQCGEPMEFYESEEGDDRGDFYECIGCGYDEDAADLDP